MKHHTLRTVLPSIAVLVASTAAAPIAMSEETEKNLRKSVLEEIIVTSQRKVQNVQDVPVSITAFTGNQLREFGMTQSTELAVQTPGLVVKSSLGDSNPIFTMRGIGLNDFSANNNPSVSIYAGEVSVPFSPMLGFQLYDIERTEVLKGPQGSLYGRNTTGGAINFIPVAPSEEFGGFINVDLGNYESVRIEGAVGGAILDNVQARLSFLVDERGEGYQHNRFDDSDHGEISRKSARLLVNWDVSESASMLVNIHGGDEHSDNPYYDFNGTIDGDGNPCAAMLDSNPNGCTDMLGYVEPDSDPWTVDADAPSEVIAHGAGGSVKLDVNFDRFSLVSITGYENFSRRLTEDYDATPFIQFNDDYSTDITSISQELRLVSNATWDFEWIVGAYFLQDTVDGFTENNSDDLFFRSPVEFEQDTTSEAAFAHVVMPISPALSARVGIRYTHESKDFTGGADTRVNFGDGIYVSVGKTFTDDTLNSDDWSWTVGLDWRVNEDSLYYVTASKGFKSGGYSGGYSGQNEQLLPVQPEEVYGLEVGSKLTLLDGMMRWNSAVYFYDWKDFQARGVAGSSGIPFLRLINAGDAEVFGVETSLNWTPIDGLDLMLGGNYFFKSEVVDAEDPIFEGKTLTNAPELSLNGLVRYQFDELGLGISPYLQVDFNYENKVYFFLSNKPTLVEDGYFKANAKIGTSLMNGRADLSLWVKNIAEEEYKVGGFDSSGFTADPIYWSGPRTYGVSFKYDL